jgi:hypothetical protein
MVCLEKLFIECFPWYLEHKLIPILGDTVDIPECWIVAEKDL